MYEIEFYEDVHGHSDIEEFVKELREKAAGNKDARINLAKLLHTLISLKRWALV